MVFNKLLALAGSEGAVDIFTLIDSTVKDCPEIGKMLLIYSDGRVEGHLDEVLIEEIGAIVRQTEWTRPVSLWLQNPAGEKYRVFWDRMADKFRAVVFGGGHISQPLVQMLSLLDFEVAVIDDRPEFANRVRFPGAHQVICDRFSLALNNLTIDNDTAVIIVTRGHRYDLDCLRATMTSPARYLGVIGSRRRIREIVNLLREEGAPADLATRLRAPIGLDIKAETPAEIAVSIVAEVVAVFRGGAGVSLSGPKEGI